MPKHDLPCLNVCIYLGWKLTRKQNVPENARAFIVDAATWDLAEGIPLTILENDKQL